MASKETWEKLRYFKPENTIDNWGDPDAIDDEHLLKLDDFRHFINCPIIVTHAVKESGHKKNSYHYQKKGTNGELQKAVATDIIIPNYGRSNIDLILDALRFGFTGLGYYPHWSYGGKMVGGLHLDSRPLKWNSDNTLNYSGSRWMGIKTYDSQEYIPLTFENIVAYSPTEQLNSGPSRNFKID